MKYVSLLIATALSTVIVIFSARNPGMVAIDLLIWKVEMPLFVALLGAGLLGMLAGGYLVAALKIQLPAKEKGAKKIQ